jgi:hypothetical protein
LDDFSYLRLFADEAGESHFDEVEVPLELTDFAPPADPAHLASLGEATALAVVAGDETWGGAEPHPAPARQFMVSLLGAVEVTASDGDVRRVGPGEALLIEDTTGKGHSTRAIGDITFLIVRMAGGGDGG